MDSTTNAGTNLFKLDGMKLILPSMLNRKEWTAPN